MLTHELKSEFNEFLAIGSKDTKATHEAIFKSFGPGVMTGRNAILYSFNQGHLLKRVEQFCDDYNSEIFRYQQKGKPRNIDTFINYDKVKWSESLKAKMQSGRSVSLDLTKIAPALYRPFAKMLLYYDDILCDRPGIFRKIVPRHSATENLTIWLKIGTEMPIFALMVKVIADQLPQGGSQCFPFYTYDEDGSNRKENITDWSLEEFRSHYKDRSIQKWDIFHYVYAVLHHLFYRERYAANLKRELPRIPFAPDFHSFAQAGKQLAELHVEYEKQPEYQLEMIESPDTPLDWRVEKMRLLKDKTNIIYNDFLTLSGIPSEAFEYRLGNRSALEWVIDQYQVSTDKRSGITNDPNREDDPQYIVRLIGQVITVSLETMKIVRSLPGLGIEVQD